jgi:hypothetical protein
MEMEQIDTVAMGAQFTIRKKPPFKLKSVSNTKSSKDDYFFSMPLDAQILATLALTQSFRMARIKFSSTNERCGL